MKNRTKLALLISVIFVVVTFFSLFYVTKEQNHRCVDRDCPICACMHQAEQALKTLGDGAAEAVVSLAVFVMAIGLIARGFTNLVCKSLITQKVQMNH